jgi:hypothetical protein
MDYDIVKASAENAYKNYKTNDSKFYSSMDSFFKEGKKNPSVAKILLQDCVSKHQKQAIKMMEEIAAIPGPEFLEPSISNSREILYRISLTNAKKCIDAADLYKNTEYIGEDDTMALGSEHQKEFNAAWRKLYPKTGKLRNRIIEAKRISMDKVTLKPSWFEKINFAKPISEFKKDYPKTILTRYKLVMDNQIREGEVTPKVSGWLKRFTYKMLINGKFKFKK